MDIVVEVADTLLWDHVYSYFLPLQAMPYDYPNAAANATAETYSTWSYQPASKYLSMTPTEAAYTSRWARDNIWRQTISLFFMLWVFAELLYIVFASLSYWLIFDKRTLNHPKFIKNQISLEIRQANRAIPVIAVCTTPFMLAEIRGHTKLFDTPEEAPSSWYMYAQFPCFLIFTDCLIYLIHRGLHHPLVYKHLHKPHHKWIMPTPFASHAFHPIDGFLQSLPYHLYPFLFPLQKWAYIILFIFVNFWSILIHDGEFLTNNPVVNGAACHSVHHSRFEYNYGQFFTAFDRIGGTYRLPEAWMFEREVKMDKKTWQAESSAVDTCVKEIEGSDERAYEPAVEKKTK